MRRFLMGVLMIAGVQGVPAQDLPPSPAAGMDAAVIGARTLAGAQGRISVNEAAGSGNQQANAAAIAINPAEANASIHLTQTGLVSAAAQSLTVSIGEHAFAGASGLMAINQAAGSGNAQRNEAEIAVGAHALATQDSLLASVRAGNQELIKRDEPSASRRGVKVADTAFEGARGLLQLNQTGGAGNLSSNHFELRMSAGPNP